MNKKIELIQDADCPNSWHWIILEYSNDTWHNVDSGLEVSFSEAVEQAKIAYNAH